MPKVSEEHRDARRAQITAAALACFARTGFQHTSMADIVAESGLSPGAIYLHFRSKQEIALAAGRQVLSQRLGELDQIAEAGADPVDALRALVTAMTQDLGDSGILLQLWGEATSNAQMDDLVAEIFAHLKHAWGRYLASWARRQGVAAPEEWAATRAPALLALAQGFFVQRNLARGFDPDAYFRAVRAAVATDLLCAPSED